MLMAVGVFISLRGSASCQQGVLTSKSDLSVPCCLRPLTDLQSHLVTMCPVTSCAGSSWPGQAAPASGYLTLLTTHTTTRTHAPQLRAGLM